jgi:hypothetical protein
MAQATPTAAPSDPPANHWLDMSNERLARDYLMVHARKAEDDGRYVCHAAMMEAARRLLGLPYWPDS